VVRAVAASFLCDVLIDFDCLSLMVCLIVIIFMEYRRAVGPE
jgi:hypothetical protein